LRVFSLIATLITIALIAIPIAVVVSLIRRMGQFTDRLRDPSRHQRVFAEHAAAALRRAGAEPEALAKLERLGRDPAKIETDLRVAAYEARIGLQRPAAPEPARVFDDPPRAQALRRPPRPRPRPTQSPSLGLDLGESFRLSEPPEINEPHAPFAISNWLAVALFAGAAAWAFLR
jgi:type II secretory pathway pseudopilin PulG